MVSISDGCVHGYSTIALPQLQSNETDDALQLSESQGSWFAATAAGSGIIFAPLGGALSSKIGRKKLVLICSPMVVIGWMFIANATDKYLLFTGRLISAIATYAMMSAPSAYISEIAHPDFRATLASLPGFSLSVGLSLVWVLGYFFTWKTIAFLSIIPPSILIILLLYLPESPYWLVKEGKNELAQKSLRFYRPINYNITDEFDEINQKNVEKKFHLRRRNFRPFFKAFFRPFSCVGILWILNMWSGYPALSVYLISIMEASGSPIDPALVPTMIGIMRVSIAGILPFLVQKFPPKMTFAIGQFLKAVSMTFIGLFFTFQYLYPRSMYVAIFNWVPFVMIITQFFLRSVAVQPVLYTLVGELFPTEIRTLAVGIVQSSFFASAFIIGKF